MRKNTTIFHIPMLFFCTFAFSKKEKYEIKNNFNDVHVDFNDGVFF